MRFH